VGRFGIPGSLQPVSYTSIYRVPVAPVNAP
jgi:hypothetical protein